MAAVKSRLYRATVRGECPAGHWRQPGETFETTEKKARWMEDITPPEPAKVPKDD